MRQSCGVPPRVAILPPVPVPYREPLFRTLAKRGAIVPHVLYLAASQPGWDQPGEWFSEARGYESETLSAWQRTRPGRARVTVLVFSELTPWSDTALSVTQRPVHRLLAPRAAGFVVASSQGVERLRSLGVDPRRVEVALQSADLSTLRPAEP